MTNIIVSCPTAISFIFKYCPNDDPVKAGSIGVGCTIDTHVSVSVKKAYRMTILFNTQPINFPTVIDVISQLIDSPVEVAIQSPLPIGCGFGISGASALTTVYAINQLCSLKKSKKELSEIAHSAEIRNKTGLGTVATQITGGFLIKHTPGLPVHATRLPYAGQSLYLTILDKIETPRILSDPAVMNTVQRAADQALEKIHRASNPSLSHIVNISYDYILASGLPMSKNTQNVIESIRKNGGAATMAILGQTVISTTPPPAPVSYPVEMVTISTNRVTG